MIEISPITDGNWYTPTMLATLLGRVDVRVCLFGRSGIKPKVFKVGSAPWEGSKDIREDRECFHHNFSGNVKLVPADGFETIQHYTVPERYVSSWGYWSEVEYDLYTVHPDKNNMGNTLTYSHCITYGQDVVQNLPQQQCKTTVGLSRVNWKVNWSVRSSWNGDELTVDFYRRGWSTTSPRKDLWGHQTYRFWFDSPDQSATRLTGRWAYGSTYSESADPGLPALTNIQSYSIAKQILAGWTENLPDPESMMTSSDLALLGRWISQYDPPDDINVWGDLCEEAIGNAQAIDINSIAYLKELVGMKDSLIGIYKLLQGDASPKNISRLFLSARYGLNLTYKDTKEIAEAFRRSAVEYMKPRNRSVRSAAMRYSTINQGLLPGIQLRTQYNYKVYYDPKSLDSGNLFAGLFRKMMDWDLFPTTQNLWDLIPYSFVVDWFVDFEALFSRTDTHLYSYTLNVHGTIKGRKSTFDSIPVEWVYAQSKEGWKYSGVISYSRYERRMCRNLDLPRFRLDTQKQFDNFAELTAIVLAKR